MIVALRSETKPKTRDWTRTSVNFLLDTILLVAVVTIAGTAAIVRFIFPGAKSAEGWTLWGWSRDDWLDFQFAAIAVFALLILLHVMLHWSWVCGVVSNKLSSWRGRQIRINDASRTLWGAGLLILIVILLGLLLAVAAIMIRRAPT
jgi:hypothetical protein